LGVALVGRPKVAGRRMRTQIKSRVVSQNGIGGYNGKAKQELKRHKISGFASA
jgi:hypothetical protein